MEINEIQVGDIVKLNTPLAPGVLTVISLTKNGWVEVHDGYDYECVHPSKLVAA